MRKTYIDNIRRTAVLLVLIYHVCYMFNGVGVPGGIQNAENIPAFDVLAYVVYWFELPAIYNYAIALAAELIITFSLYEVLKRVPIARYLILGIFDENQF